MKYKLLYLLLLLTGSGATYGQHAALTSQYITNGLVINPAYAGSRDAYSALISYRRQWTGISGSPSTFNVSIHGPLSNEKHAVGLMVYHDAIGVRKDNGLFGTYAYRLPFKDGKLAFGLSAGLRFLRADWAAVQTTTSGDQVFQSNSPLYVLPDFSAGIRYTHERFFAGFSMPMMLTHDTGIHNVQHHTTNNPSAYNYLLVAGTSYPASEMLVLKPSVLLRYMPASGAQTDLNVLAEYGDKFGLGLSYRTSDALIGLAQFRLNNQFILGYSYDFTLSRLRTVSSGSHELMLRYDFKYKVNAADPRFFH